MATKYMPVSRMCIGVDLDPIRNIPNCHMLQQDITTRSSLSFFHYITHIARGVPSGDQEAHWRPGGGRGASLSLVVLLFALMSSGVA